MPKFNPIFTFSKINLKLTKKSSYFIFSNFLKKILEFYIVSFQKEIVTHRKSEKVCCEHTKEKIK